MSVLSSPLKKSSFESAIAVVVLKLSSSFLLPPTSSHVDSKQQLQCLNLQYKNIYGYQIYHQYTCTSCQLKFITFLPLVSALYSESASSVLEMLSTPTLSEVDPLRAYTYMCTYMIYGIFSDKMYTLTFLACSSRFFCFSRISSRAFALLSSLELSLSSICGEENDSA